MQEIRDAAVTVTNIVVKDAPGVVASQYKTGWEQALEDEVSPNGVPYAPLRERSKYPRKKTRDPKNKILDDTGMMKKGVRVNVTPGSAEIYWDYRDDRGKQPQVFHQYGTPKMVARPVAGLSNKIAKRIAEALRSLVKTKTGGNPITNALADAIIDESEYGE